MPCFPQSSTESRCSSCHEVFAGNSPLITDVWSCSAIKIYFLVRPKRRSRICGFCGSSFDAWSIFSLGDRHLSVVHKQSSCNRDKKFFEPHQFRQHLVDAHNGVQGWWLDSLEQNAKCKTCRSCIPDAIISPGSPFPDPPLGSISLPRSLSSHHDDANASGFDVVQQPSCNASRTNSMHRVHSDVSEYDAQGSLLKRTITDSYTSVPDDAAPALQRSRPSSGSPARKPARRLMTPQSQLFCFECPDSTVFASTIELTRHLCTEHSSIFVETLKHRRLRQAYRRQKKQLRWTLDLLSQDVVKTVNAEEGDAALKDQIAKALEELDLDCQNDGDGGPLLPDSDDSEREDNPCEDSRHDTPAG